MSGREFETVDIGQKILEIRKQEGLSQTEFAEKFNVTRQTVSNWEHGRNYPDMETLMRISDEYDITFDELVKKDKELMRSIDRSRMVASKSLLIFSVIAIAAVAVLIVKLLPSVVSKFYYDPTQVVSTYDVDDEFSIDTGRLESDIRVYSELYLPELKYENADITPLGYGKYDFTLTESAWIMYSLEHEVNGQIERGHIQIYDPASFRIPESDVFMRDTAWMPNAEGEMMDALDRLDDNGQYIAYITLKEDTDYTEACKWIDKYGTGFPWACIVTERGEDPDIMGVYTDYCGIDAAFDMDKYPYLFGYEKPFEDHYEEKLTFDEDTAMRHFISMMQYEIDNPEFLEMLWGDTTGIKGESLSDWMGSRIKYVKKNGMKVYGFAVDADKETLIEIAKSNRVCWITTEKNS